MQSQYLCAHMHFVPQGNVEECRVARHAHNAAVPIPACVIVRAPPGFRHLCGIVKTNTENVSETLEGCPNLEVDRSCRISIGIS